MTSNTHSSPIRHILYAFADVRPDSGVVHITDAWADKDIHYPGDKWDEPGNNLYGNFKALFKLKQQNRHLKTLLSIGGWTYSPHFHPIVVSELHRKNFVITAVQLMESLGLDGLDIDYEYPSNAYQARGYVTLLKELREALDLRAKTLGIDYKFLLTVSTHFDPAGPRLRVNSRSLLLVVQTTTRNSMRKKWTMLYETPY